MRTLVVVVQAILANDHLQIALVDDQHRVEAFPATALGATLGVRICSSRPQRSQDHPGPLRLECLISLERKLLVPTVDQDAELDPFLFELLVEIASSLRGPGRHSVPRCSSPARLDVTPDAHIEGRRAAKLKTSAQPGWSLSGFLLEPCLPRSRPSSDEKPACPIQIYPWRLRACCLQVACSHGIGGPCLGASLWRGCESLAASMQSV